MATTLAGVSLSPSTARVVAKTDSPKIQTTKSSCLNYPWMTNHYKGHRMMVRTMATAPESTSQVADSIKNAEETCAGDPVSGECAAAWDEVEEVSAAASDKRLKEKESDPLEKYCNDNPETDECRTYDN